MIIKKVKLENIRSYENQEIIFPSGSTVLAGDIGSGKTSVLLAIEFALFGLQPGQKGTGLLRNGKDEGSVSLEIEVDGKLVKLERSLKRGKSVTQDYAKIEIDGVKEEISITELKNRVLELLNYPKEFAKKTNLLYRFTVYTPQEEMKQIVLEDKEIRLNTLRHIFGIDKYKLVKENTELFTAKLREEVRNLEGQIKDLEETRKKLEGKKSSLEQLGQILVRVKEEVSFRKSERKKAESELKQIEEKIKEKENYEREIEKTRIMLLGKKELAAGMENELSALSKQIEESRKIKFESEKLQLLENEIKERERETENLDKEYVELLTKINSINIKITEDKKSKEQISFLRICPTCLQDVDDGYKKNIARKLQEEIEKNEKTIFSLMKNKEEHSKKIAGSKQSANLLKKELEELKFFKIRLDSIKEKEERLEGLKKQKVLPEKDILLLEKQIETLKESVSLLKKFEILYEQKNRELLNSLEKEKEKEIELASREKEKELTLISIGEISREIENKEFIKKKLNKISELEDWFSSSFLSMISFTERNIMMKLREEFSKLFNEWFNTLVPEIFSVKLDEDFTPLIEQQDFQLDYSFLSGGERTAIALAYRLALNQVINSLLSKIKTRELIILDEPTDGFSEQQLDKIRDVLQQLKVKQLIIVSHESMIESFVENIIKFKKEEGITKVS